MERHEIPSAIEACKHFNNNEHTFSKHGKFIILSDSNLIQTHNHLVRKRTLKHLAKPHSQTGI